MAYPTAEELIHGADSLKSYLDSRFDTRYASIGLGKDKLFVYLQNDYMNKHEVKSVIEAIKEWEAINTHYIVVDIRKIGKIIMGTSK